MRKILFYIPSFESGGAERVASVMINYWNSKEKYEIEIVNTLPKNKDFFTISPQISRIFLDFNYNKQSFGKIKEKFSRIRKLRKTLSNSNEDFIISFLTTPSILILLASVGLNKRIVCCEHTNYYSYGNKVSRCIRNFLYFLLADKITVLTKRDLSNYPKYLRSKIFILPNPLGVDGFKLSSEKIQDFSKNRLANSTTKFLFVGRLNREKGIERLCSILYQIRHEDWKLSICGDGPLRKYLEDFIDKNNLFDKVSLKGAVSNIQDYYSKADVLLMTSLWEGLPMVIAEAMSFKLPVIAFDCPTGPRELIKDSQNGILVPDGDIDRYIQELTHLIHAPHKIEFMSRHTRNSVIKYKIEKIDEIWDQVLAKK